MPLWTFYGLKNGKVSTAWPKSGDDGQAGVLGMPRFDPARCQEGCQACADTCLPKAITMLEGEEARLSVDYGRCVACQLCVEVCPSGAFTASNDWAFGVSRREDLHWAASRTADAESEALKTAIKGVFGRSLHIRHVDAGSCNGCESELQALNNPFYNLHRLGIFFTPSPRFADLLLVTGPVTYAMRGPLLEAYEAMPDPKFVMAMGTCAVSGGTNGGGYACGNGLDGVLPVDVYVPGCPPNPAAIIHALLMLLERAPQCVRRGHMIGGASDA